MRAAQRPIFATRRPDSPTVGKYTCPRCGIVRSAHAKRPTPKMCRDCRDVERGEK